MEAEAWGGIQPKKEPIEEVDKPVDATNLYSGHDIKDEMVIGPVVLQKLETSLIRVNSKVADISRTHQNKLCIYPNRGPGHSEQSKNCNRASLTTQLSDRAVKVEPEVPNGDMALREGAFSQLNVSSVDGHHSGVQHTWSGDGPCMLKVIKVIKIEYEPPAEAQLNIPNGEEEPSGTTHTQSYDPKIASGDTIIHDVPMRLKGAQSKGENRKDNLKKLSQIHAKGNPLSCDICNKQFTKKFRLKTHLMVHTKEKPFSCDVCEKQFVERNKLNMHLLVHTKEKPFSCDICNMQFREKRFLKTHLKVHAKENPFSCDVCNKQFSEKFNLKKHLMIHTKEKPYSCDICKKQFIEKNKLKVHFMVHTKEKPFSCDICNMQFREKRYLKVHLMVHTKEKPFSCDICNKQFNLKYKLKIHLNIHTKEKSISCDICKKVLHIKSDWRNIRTPLHHHCAATEPTPAPEGAPHIV